MKKKARGLKRMRDLGYRPVTANLKEAPHAAMKAWTKSQGISQSEYVAGLVAADLVKRGFLRCFQKDHGADIELELVPESDRPSQQEAFATSEFDEPPTPLEEPSEIDPPGGSEADADLGSPEREPGDEED